MPVAIDGVGPGTIQFTPTLQAAAFHDGDTMNAGTPGECHEITSFVDGAGLSRVLNTVLVNDKDDQGVGFDLYIFDRDVTLSDQNAAFAVSDADMDYLRAIVNVAAADYVDNGGNRQAIVKNLGLTLTPSSTSLWVALKSRGAGTYTAAGLVITLGFV